MNDVDHTAGRPRTGSHIPALDGVRGLAILLVIAFHARIVFTSASAIPFFAVLLLGLGWSGVDLFFVLSGFLITGILLDTRDSPDYFRTFYLRRVLRIFPLYFAYLILVLVVLRYAWLWHAGTDLWKSVNPWWYVTYLMNWKAAHGYYDLFLDSLWSLAVEEQFYLFWPAIVWLCPRRKLKWVCLAMAIGSLATRCVLSAAGTHPEAIYRLTPCRLDPLAAGAFLAVALRDFRGSVERWIRPVAALSLFAFLEIGLVIRTPIWMSPSMRTAGASLVAVGYACLVFGAAMGGEGVSPLARLFSWPLLRQCGKYSYAMYILHAIPYQLTVGWVEALPHSNFPAAMVAVIQYLYGPVLACAAFAMAWTSWRLLEQPFLRLKSRVPYRAAPVASRKAIAVAAGGRAV
ncbi:MAG TPA: acyltransferase [Bryobacteraceae bacterium]|nr:acyltransferase [Bryobacteraceae bacterium]